MGDWLLDHFGKLLAVALVVFGVVLYRTDRQGKREHAERCASLMAFARTHRDSLDVRLACDLPRERGTQMVPVVVPIYR